MFCRNTRNLLVYGFIGFIVLSFHVPQSFSQDSFTCTEVLGFSQSWQWFTGKSMAESRGNVQVPKDAFLSNWQGRFEFGASVELWGSLDFKGWEGTFLSLQMCPREKVDRIIFNISGRERDTKQWEQAILKASTPSNH